MTTIHGQERGEAAAHDHRGLDVLGFDECLRRVTSTPIGRIAFRDGADMVILPVNHVVDGTMIAFRARWDSRLASSVSEHPIAFEVDHYDTSTHTGWSVLVKGTAETIYDETECQRLEGLLKVPWTGRPESSFWTSIRPDEVSGRELGVDRGACGCC